LENKIAACTTDNSANKTSAIHLCYWRHISCFVHSFSLIVQSSLEEIKETKVKNKSIVEYFEKSTLATEKLNQI